MIAPMAGYFRMQSPTTPVAVPHLAPAAPWRNFDVPHQDRQALFVSFYIATDATPAKNCLERWRLVLAKQAMGSFGDAK
jgi:hypothetical protein